MAGRRTRLARARKTAGYTQERLADALHVDVSTVKRWETAGSYPQPYLWPKLARLLTISATLLGELLDENQEGGHRSPDTAIQGRTAGATPGPPEEQRATPHHVAVAERLDVDGESTGPRREYEPAQRGGHLQNMTALTAPMTADPYPDTNGAGGEVEDVNRKQFLAAFAATMAAPSVLLSGVEPTRIGATDVERYRQNLVHLYALDDHHGASGEVYALTVRSLRSLVRTVESASYSPAIGDQLRSITGQMTEHAGWLAFDAARHHDARYWWLEALHAARMANDTDVEVVVLASMSCAANHHGRGREAVDLACAAARIAQRGRPTPRLLSLMAAREALGHAYGGDAGATRRALDRAHDHLDRGRRDDDPSWLDFWGTSDLACHTTGATLALGDLTASERSARDALATVDQARYPRNHVSYQLYLADVLIAQRNLDEALPMIAGAVVQAFDLNSGRLTSRIRTVVHDLRTCHSDTPVVRELAEWTAAHLSTTAARPASL